MSKRLIIILALAFVVGFSFAAYAEVQNVKVSGDLTVQGVARDNFDLAKPLSGDKIISSLFDDKDRDILSITRVRVDADLTDNVSATVRLLNERNWNGESGFGGTNNGGQANRNIGLNTGGTANDENDIDLDLAYVTLKEFLYSPLSLKIGRQELRFGNGLVVGDPDTNIYSAATSISAGDLSARKSFDAIRATLDYNPLIVDLVYAKVEEATANLNDDKTLSGINANYELNKNTNIEGYIFTKVTDSNRTQAFNVDAANNTSLANFDGKSDIAATAGVRAVDKTVKNLTVDAQLAYQFGRYNPRFDPNARYAANAAPNRTNAKITRRSAWAGQLKGTYDLTDVGFLSQYKPTVSAGYTFLSGANRDAVTTASHTGWDPMFEDQTEGHIMNAIFANTNVHRPSLNINAQLTDDIAANLDYVGAWFVKRYPRDANRGAILSGVAGTTAATSGRQFILEGGKYIGQEVDAKLTYDYTEDVQFSLLGGIFLPGNNIIDVDHIDDKGNIGAASELIGSMKVTF